MWGEPRLKPSRSRRSGALSLAPPVAPSLRAARPVQVVGQTHTRHQRSPVGEKHRPVHESESG